MNSDVVFIEGLEVRCVIGDLPDERDREQVLVVSVEMGCDLSHVRRSDALEDTVDYAAASERIAAVLRAGRFQLVERAAQAVGVACLADARVERVVVTLRKPGALGSGCAGVRLVVVREG